MVPNLTMIFSSVQTETKIAEFCDRKRRKHMAKVKLTEEYLMPPEEREMLEQIQKRLNEIRTELSEEEMNAIAERKLQEGRHIAREIAQNMNEYFRNKKI